MIQREYEWVTGDPANGRSVIDDMTMLGKEGYEFILFNEDGWALMEKETTVETAEERAAKQLHEEQLQRDIAQARRQIREGHPRYDRIPEIVRLPCTKEHTHHDGETMLKVRSTILDSFQSARAMTWGELTNDVIHQLQNAGILFRERL